MSNKTILVLILLVSVILRFFNFLDIPYTHDEFSALFRTHVDSFSELISKGVIVDGHPAGVQVFLYYWTVFFGYNEWVVKLPFAAFGLFSVWLIYLIGKQWYNETVALISAAFLASLQFGVIYSQIARPYISGLLFTLLMAYCLTGIVKKPEKRFWLKWAGFIVAGTLSLYNHHFSMLFAAIIGISGLFMIRKEYLQRYIFAGFVIIALYIPHIHIFIYQLNMGGVEGWLSKPHVGFFADFVFYVFNFSYLVIAVSATIFIYGLNKSTKNDFLNNKQFLFITWFLLPLIIGFVYSVFVNAVLQYSVLIFSFPYVFFVLFGHIKEKKPAYNAVFVALIMLACTFSLVFERRHYDLFYKSPYEYALKGHVLANNYYDNVLSLIETHEKITSYYIEKNKIKPSFVNIEKFNDIAALDSLLASEAGSCDYIYLAALSHTCPLVVPLINKYFPVIKEQNNFFGGTTYLFSKGASDDKEIISYIDFSQKSNQGWTNIKEENITSDTAFSFKNSYLMQSHEEYSPVYSAPLWSVIENNNNFIDIELDIIMHNNISGEILTVTSIEYGNDILYWRATPFNFFIRNQNDFSNFKAYHALKLSDFNIRNKLLKLKIYVWNKDGNEFIIDNIEIRLRQGNPLIYGLIEKF